MNYTNQSLEISSFTDTIWGVGLVNIQLISRYNIGIRFFSLLMFLENMQMLFLCKTKKMEQVLKHFKNLQKNPTVNLARKYGYIKVVNFIRTIYWSFKN